jgi:hypothetical protein
MQAARCPTSCGPSGAWCQSSRPPCAATCPPPLSWRPACPRGSPRSPSSLTARPSGPRWWRWPGPVQDPPPPRHRVAARAQGTALRPLLVVVVGCVGGVGEEPFAPAPPAPPARRAPAHPRGDASPEYPAPPVPGVGSTPPCRPSPGTSWPRASAPSAASSPAAMTACWPGSAPRPSRLGRGRGLGPGVGLLWFLSPRAPWSPCP